VKNEALEQLDVLVGEWQLTMSDAWFLESREIELTGSATISWLGEAFLELRATLGVDHGTWHWVIGRNDARDEYVLLYHDQRGVSRLFEMTFGDGQMDARARGSRFPPAVHRECRA
jgi:hypothetical protein